MFVSQARLPFPAVLNCFFSYQLFVCFVIYYVSWLYVSDCVMSPVCALRHALCCQMCMLEVECHATIQNTHTHTEGGTQAKQKHYHLFTLAGLFWLQVHPLWLTAAGLNYVQPLAGCHTDHGTYWTLQIFTGIVGPEPLMVTSWLLLVKCCSHSFRFCCFIVYIIQWAGSHGSSKDK